MNFLCESGECRLPSAGPVHAHRRRLREIDRQKSLAGFQDLIRAHLHATTHQN
jgi:hypothetical protein